uniref:Vexin n=1 Tax=Gopherus evgoodei TaxID=1825980 RepID=A0A8C4VG62_9SAUR
MHQIYSCSDENLEVFTTVISSKCEYMLKQSSPALWTNIPGTGPAPSTVRTAAALITECPDPGRPPGTTPVAGPDHALGTVTDPSTAPWCGTIYGTLETGLTLKQPPLCHGHRGTRLSHRTRIVPPILIQRQADASLPLTGNNLCRTPGILRKMWMKHKKKSEYLGATNSAFEAD